MANHTIAVGCIGGSGSRVVARIIQAAGFHIGDDLNAELDNLWFTLLFKRRSILTEGNDRIFHLYDNLRHRMIHGQVLSPAFEEIVESLSQDDRILHPAAWLAERRASFLKGRQEVFTKIAWKEPNTHVVIDRLLELDSSLRYIHITRDGLDMAYSANLNQLRLWGSVFLDRPVEMGPKDALSYWVAVERRIREIQTRHPERVLIISYETLAFRPRDVIADILRFCGESDIEKAETFKAFVKPPDSIGRNKARDPAIFAPRDLDYARALSAHTGWISAPSKVPPAPLSNQGPPPFTSEGALQSPHGPTGATSGPKRGAFGSWWRS